MNGLRVLLRSLQLTMEDFWVWRWGMYTSRYPFGLQYNSLFFYMWSSGRGVKIEDVTTNRKNDSSSLSVDRYCRGILNLLQLNCSKKKLDETINNLWRIEAKLLECWVLMRGNLQQKRICVDSNLALYVSVLKSTATIPLPLWNT